MTPAGRGSLDPGRRGPVAGMVALGLALVLVLTGSISTTNRGHRVETSTLTPDPAIPDLLNPRPFEAASSRRAAPGLGDDGADAGAGGGSVSGSPGEPDLQAGLGDAGPPTTTAPAPALVPATAVPTTRPGRRTPSTAPAAPTGTVRPVASPEEWARAVAAAQPGDTIQLVATIHQALDYRGGDTPNDAANRGATRGVSGTPARPVTITAAPGVWIDPGNRANNKGALDILFAANVNVVGVRVRNSQFGIRIMQSQGTVGQPLLVKGNTVSDIGHAGIYVGGNWDTHAPSHHVRVEGNKIVRTGLLDPEFGEGVYLGYGAREWVDRTSNVTVVGNDISYTGAEGIDIKPGVRHVLVEGNSIHDLSPIAGGAISACYVGGTPDPEPSQSADIVLRRNRIWNLDLDDRAGSNDWAIWVGHGGVTIDANAVWGLRGDPASTRAVRVRSPVPFGSFPIHITNNLFWTATGWVAEGSPSGAGLVRASGNRGPDGAVGVELRLAPRKGAPAVGAGGTADSGSGPGSALGFS